MKSTSDKFTIHQPSVGEKDSLPETYSIRVLSDDAMSGAQKREEEKLETDSQAYINILKQELAEEMSAERSEYESEFASASVISRIHVGDESLVASISGKRGPTLLGKSQGNHVSGFVANNFVS